MLLRNARLCLDCEEIHQDQHCPVCASESFMFLTRWLPAEEQRTRRRERPAPDAAAREAAAQPATIATAKAWVASGVAGAVAVALGRWLWRKQVSFRD
jgi:hypothetical protein